MESNIARYLRLLEELRDHRNREMEIMDKMDLVWQAMSLEERAEIRDKDPEWPPPSSPLPPRPKNRKMRSK